MSEVKPNGARLVVIGKKITVANNLVRPEIFAVYDFSSERGSWEPVVLDQDSTGALLEPFHDPAIHRTYVPLRFVDVFSQIIDMPIVLPPLLELALAE